MTLLAPPERTARARKPAASTLATALIALSAGLLAAGCSAQAGHPHADSRGARRLPATTSPHPAPTVVHPTTPAPRPRPPGRSANPTAPPPTALPPTALPPTALPPTAPAPTAPASSGGPQPAPLAQCSTRALRISLDTAGVAAGSVYYRLEFTNASGMTCTMYGYPGVSFVSRPGGGGLGGPAVRNPTVGPALVTLTPGAVAHASVQVAVAQNYPRPVCEPVMAHWLRIYPPGQFAPLYTDLTAMTCTGTIPGGSTLGIYVVRPGATGP